MEVLTYQTFAGRRPYAEWVRGLKDQRSATVIRNRLKRVRQGHFGDHRYISDSVWEMRIFFGPGYRVYYLMDGQQLVLLLCGGEKDSQDSDIEKARGYAADYWRRK